MLSLFAAGAYFLVIVFLFFCWYLRLLISFYLKKNLLIPVPRDNRWFFDYLQLLNEYEELVSPRMNRFSRTRQNRIIFLNRIIRYYQKEFSSEIEEYLEYLKHEYEELLSLHS
uniref:Uncharacterized protein n=1 Tax=Rhizophagus irregularis (strain DAOM 181602 / DAOM 197198 / MUCL 43194) TaxID=747089 RepID=U9SZG2_RHIID